MSTDKRIAHLENVVLSAADDLGSIVELLQSQVDDEAFLDQCHRSHGSTRPHSKRALLESYKGFVRMVERALRRGIEKE